MADVHGHANSHCLKHAGIGVVASALLVLTAYLLGETSVGRAGQNLAYTWLMSTMSPISNVQAPLVVDIGKIAGTERAPTSRRQLLELLEIIAKERPKAIAIDIDFSTNGASWQTHDDVYFFDQCLDLNRRGIHVFLGVNRTRTGEPNAWLGLPQYADLAAGGYAKNSDPHVPRFIESGDARHPLPSFAERLATVYRKKSPTVPGWIAWAIDPDPPLGPANMLVNYSKLEQIKLEKRSITVDDKETVSVDTNGMADRLILLGAVEEARDKFIVPSEPDTVPGVLIVAAATLTLAMEPVYELSGRTQLALDVIVSAAIILGLYRICRSGSGLDALRRANKFLLIAIGAVLLSGVALARLLGVMWLEFPLVIFALFLHPSVANWCRLQLAVIRKRPAPHA